MSDTERRHSEKSVAEERRRGPDSLRANPEVMERSEPQTQTRTMPPRQSETSSEMANVRMRFDQLQSEFIEDPKGAVKKAQQLMDDMLKKMTERVQSTNRDVEKTDDTEKLRLGMRSYRDILDSSGGRRSA